MSPSAECTGFLSPAELLAAQTLHRRAPYAIAGVSHGMLSIARHAGGMKFQGCSYTYFPEHDECVRDDVVKLVSKMRRAAGRKNHATRPAAVQPELELQGEGGPK